MSELKNKKCHACKTVSKAMSPEEAQNYMSQISKHWSIDQDSKKITSQKQFENFAQALAYTNAVGELAESEGHHPDIILKWGFTQIDLWTHSVKGLSENDFIMAAKIDLLENL